MKITILEENDQLIAVLEGRLDTFTSKEVEKKMSPCLYSPKLIHAWTRK